MAVIYSYPIATPKLGDLILGTSIGGQNPTKSYTVQSLAELLGAVTQIVAGTDISISPLDGKGIVTINSTVDPGVTSIIAGDNINLVPAAGTGDVTVGVSNVVLSVSTGDANTILIGGTNISPTVSANLTSTIASGGVNLVAAGTIYDFVDTNYIPYTQTSTSQMQFVDDNSALGTSNTVVPTQLAVKTYVDNAVTGQLVYQGGYNAATNTPDLTTSPNSILKGWTYTVTTAGTFFTETVEVGDLLIAESDNPTSLSNWTTVQNNIGVATDTIQGIANFPIAGGLSVTAGAVSLPDSGVTAGSYTLSDITVDAKGRITSASSGTVDIGVSDLSSASGTFITIANLSSATGSIDLGTVDLSATGTPSTTTFLRGDNTWATVATEDNYVDGISFNTADGVLTLTRTGTLADLTQDLDGRYALASDVPANIVQTVTTTNSTFIDLTPTTPSSGAVTVTAGLSATGTPNTSTFLRGDNTWSTALTSVGITSTLSTIAISNSPLTGNGDINIDLSASGVTPGSYTNSNITVDTYGRITVASSGAGGGVTDFTNANGTFISYTTENTAATGSVTTGQVDLSATGTPSATTFLRGDNSWTDQADVVSGASTIVEIEVKNLEGAPLVKGDPVYLLGTVGASSRMEVGLADASNVAKMPSIGILAQDLAINGEGFAVVTGTLKNLVTTPIDGATATTGDTIYVKPGGGLTLTKPTGSTNFIQNVGQVGRVSTVSDGSILASCIMRANDVPNLPTGKIWVGDGNTAVSDVVYLDETNSRMGINTLTPGTALEVAGGGQVNFKMDIGSSQPAGALSLDVRQKAYVRAGMVISPNPTAVQVDNSSLVVGSGANDIVSGSDHCLTVGSGNQIISDSDRSVSFGNNNETKSSDNSLISGNSNILRYSNNSHVIGSNNQMGDDYAVGNTAGLINSLIVGSDNTLVTDDGSSAPPSGSLSFVIGHGNLLRATQQNSFSFGYSIVNIGGTATPHRNNFNMGGNLRAVTETMTLGYRNNATSYPAEDNANGLGATKFVVATGSQNDFNSNALLITEGGASIGGVQQIPRVILPTVVNLNFANDTLAAAGGIPVGGLYHNTGILRIRIT